MNIQSKRSGLVEEVNGTIIGGFTHPYEFWTRDGTQRIDRNYFENDEEATAWFKEHYPDHFKVGVEMRVFDS